MRSDEAHKLLKHYRSIPGNGKLIGTTRLTTEDEAREVLARYGSVPGTTNDGPENPSKGPKRPATRAASLPPMQADQAALAEAIKSTLETELPPDADPLLVARRQLCLALVSTLDQAAKARQLMEAAPADEVRQEQLDELIKLENQANLLGDQLLQLYTATKDS